MKLKNFRWTMVMVGVIGPLMVGTMVWASPQAAGPSAPLPAYDANNADKVDDHHAGPSNGTKTQRVNRVLWADKRGQLHWKAMPKGALNKRYLNDDRQETISAAAAGSLLTVNNTGSGRGVTGRSANDFGVLAWGAGDGDGYDRVGDLLLEGTRGEIFAFGNYLNLYSDWNVNISLDDDNNDTSGAFRIWNGADNQVFRVEEDGDTWALGSKSSLVQTETYGQRLLYAMESPEVWFEDFGTGQLVNGQAKVTIDPIFAQTADLTETYHVFLTPLGEDPVLLFVTAKNATSFTVRGVTLDGEPAACAFDYRIVAKRLGYENVRIEPIATDMLAKK